MSYIFAILWLSISFSNLEIFLDKRRDKRLTYRQCEFTFPIMWNKRLILLLVIITVFAICIEANCVCRINHRRKTLKVTKNHCSYGSVPQLRIFKTRYGLKTYKSCRCTCVAKHAHVKHHSDYWSRINWSVNCHVFKYMKYILYQYISRDLENISLFSSWKRICWICLIQIWYREKLICSGT